MYPKDLDWRVLEKHDKDSFALLKELGYLVNGQIRKFDGKVFWPRYEAMGHTKMAVGSCICYLGRK